MLVRIWNKKNFHSLLVGIHNGTVNAKDRLFFFFFFFFLAKLNIHFGNPLQYSCPENPWTVEPGRLQSMGSQRVGHNWVTSHSFLLNICLPNKKAITLFGIYSKELKTYVLTKAMCVCVCVCVCVCRNTLHDCQKLETTKRSFSRWMDFVIHQNDGLLFSTKKKWAPLLPCR